MNRPTAHGFVLYLLPAMAIIGVGAITYQAQDAHNRAVVAAIREGFRDNERSRAAALAQVKADTAANRAQIARNQEFIGLITTKLGIERAEVDRLRGDVP